MQDYIESNLLETISLHDLAKVAGYSPWHSDRIFKELISITPFEYIRALRLSRAAEKLRDQDAKIVDVALDFVFDSHEGFTRAFSKRFGISPKHFSKNATGIKLFMPAYIREYYSNKQKGEPMVKNQSNNKTVFVQVIDRPQRKLILKRGIKATHYFEYCEEVGCDIWEILSGIKAALYEPIGMWLPNKLQRSGTSTYVQGVEVPLDYTGKVPEGFEVIDFRLVK
jgi:AraC family transcriptional regulator